MAERTPLVTDKTSEDDGWKKVAEETGDWHPSLQDHTKRLLATRGLLNPSILEEHSQDGVPIATGKTDVLGSLQFDTAEADQHGQQKAGATIRRDQELKHRTPAVGYNRQRRKRQKEAGEHYTSRRTLEERARRYDIVEAELRREQIEVRGSRLDRRERQEVDRVIARFNRLFGFLGEGKQSGREVIDEYQAIPDTKARLRYFHAASFADKIALLCSDEFEYANYDNFINALEFQQDFIDGRATIWEQECEDGECVDVQSVLDPSKANPHDIRLGLKRASLRSAMLGTPEYGAYKMALQIRANNEDEDSRDPRDDFPKIHGYHSDITDSSIGDWATIIDQYQKYAEKFAKRHPDLSDEEMEHDAVRNIARLYAKSMEYQCDRGAQSPYVSTFEESLAWAQLGDQVQAQLRGMRQKIRSVDLHGIERFVGKSGTSEKLQSYRREAYSLGKNLETAKLGGAKATELLERENAFELGKQERWKDRELLRLEHKWSREISKTRSEERRARYQQKWDDAVAKVVSSYNAGVAHYTDRGIDTLIQDMESRLVLVQDRIEKRKSIAEKAIDLHFALSADRKEWDEDANSYVWRYGSEYGQLIDWINDAPFGVIKRAHKHLWSGVSPDEVCRSAISEIFTKVTGAESDVEIQSMLNDFDSNKREMRRMMRLAGVLGAYNITLSFDKLRDISAKDTRWIRESLDMFEFEDVQQFIDHGLNLSIMPKVSKPISEFGYDLDTTELIGLAQQKVMKAYHYKEIEDVLSASLRQFTLDKVKQAVSEGIDLKVLNALKPYLSAHGVSDFSVLSGIAKKITEHSGGVNGGEHLMLRYKVAVEDVGLDRANDLLNMNADIDMFNLVNRQFGAQTGGDYQKTLELLEKVNRAATEGAEQELPAIRTMKRRYSNNQILSLYDKGVSAEAFVDVFGADEGAVDGKTLSFDRQVGIISHATGSIWDVKDAIKHFDMAALTQLIDKNLDVTKAYDISLQLKNKEGYQKLNTIENIVYLTANDLSVETFGRTIQAGFSIDEIKKYPFLASNLLNPHLINTTSS